MSGSHSSACRQREFDMPTTTAQVPTRTTDAPATARQLV